MLSDGRRKAVQTGIPDRSQPEEIEMRFPSQTKPVTRAATGSRDASAAVTLSDCCGAGQCCVGACFFGKCAGVCVPNIGQC